eukprot:6620862-Prymnesium_polylepis.1
MNAAGAASNMYCDASLEPHRCTQPLACTRARRDHSPLAAARHHLALAFVQLTVAPTGPCTKSTSPRRCNGLLPLDTHPGFNQAGGEEALLQSVGGQGLITRSCRGAQCDAARPDRACRVGVAEACGVWRGHRVRTDRGSSGIAGRRVSTSIDFLSFTHSEYSRDVLPELRVVKLCLLHHYWVELNADIPTAVLFPVRWTLRAVGGRAKRSGRTVCASVSVPRFANSVRNNPTMHIALRIPLYSIAMEAR